MYVVGATKADRLKQIRDLAPKAFFLVPGVGAQGGDLKAVYDNGSNEEVGLLVNSSRGIIYASSGEDFAEAAANSAKKLQLQMKSLLAS
jgi:orotidine-5'-phosphate decarboxylase